MKIDFTGVEAGFKPMPAANYPAVVEKATVEKTTGKEAKGTHKIVIVGKITDGEYEGRKGWINLALTKDSLWRVKQCLFYLGIPEEDMTDDKFETDDILPMLPGTNFIMAVSEYEYENEIRNGFAVLDPEKSEEVGVSLVRF